MFYFYSVQFLNRYVNLLSIFENVIPLVELNLYKTSDTHICKVTIQSATGMVGYSQNFVFIMGWTTEQK